MNDTGRSILEMLRDGQISLEEAERLMDAVIEKTVANAVAAAVNNVQANPGVPVASAPPVAPMAPIRPVPPVPPFAPDPAFNQGFPGNGSDTMHASGNALLPLAQRRCNAHRRLHRP